jgi:DNA ligase D-like protein (predicted 3'-phosphoesterase)
MSIPSNLQDYLDKRDFSKTDEPEREEWTDPGGEFVFVIHKHDASNLHYDLRLQVGETLKSWAVPKGPSTDPSEKRLAIPTEDHPLAYADFEGTIPEDEYGGGTTLVWDAGTYRNLKRDGEDGEIPLEDQIDDGHLTVWLEGEKLTGGFALIRSGGGETERWLLVKMDDQGADARRNPTSTQPESVLTGRTLEEVEKEESEKDNDS